MRHGHMLEADFTLEVLAGKSRTLSADVERRVSELWSAETSRTPHLFDGYMVSVIEHRRDHITVRPTSYRYWLAQTLDPQLGSALEVKPLAVSGVLSCPEGVLLGLRAAHVLQSPGLWELAPAGSVSGLDPVDQLFEEMTGELGIPRAWIRSCEVAGLLEDTDSGVHDIVFRLETDRPAASLVGAHRKRGSDEYSEVRVVSPTDLLARTANVPPGLTLDVLPILRLAVRPS